MLNRDDLELKLKKTFDIDHFYDEQWDAIERLLKRERVLLINKTGFGKSLCFQFPATHFEGTTIIFSPLIALMRDQVKKLKQLGISANCIHSEQPSEMNAKIINAAINGRIKILYIAPERQNSTIWMKAAKKINISMVAIDEAHCISMWGHDFRPAFQSIIKLINLLPSDTPVLAATATATKIVEEDIAAQIKGDISILRGTLIRPNLKLFVIKVDSEDEKLIWLGQNLEKIEGNGIIYTGTRSTAETYSKWLRHLKIPAAGYHAGLDNYARVEIENGLINNEWKCVVSTNALGMGIDKPDIRFIVHTQIPQSPIHYYQEIGRAGRDNQEAHVILFYNESRDLQLPEAFINNSRPAISKYEMIIALTKNSAVDEATMMKTTNINKRQIRAINNDLIDQGIIKEIKEGTIKKYQFNEKSRPLNTEKFETLRNRNLANLDKMVEYVNTDDPRMQYLCEFLSDENAHDFSNCDNTNLTPLELDSQEEWEHKLQDFRENSFPQLYLKSPYTRMADGTASSLYDVSIIGSAIRRCKYETGTDFPDYFIRLGLIAFRKKFGRQQFDFVAYVPSTVSGDQVKNYATTLSKILEIPLTHDLIRIKKTKEQRKLNNQYTKLENVSNAFIFKNPEHIKGKSILLIDDIFDSGTTLSEIGKLLTNLKVSNVSPLVIAKTSGMNVL